MMKISVFERQIGQIPILEVVLDSERYTPLPLIIFYHGWQTSKELVLTQARKLAQHRIRVILPDAMFHGERKMPVSTIPSATFWTSIQFNFIEFDSLIDYYHKKRLIADNLIGVGGYSMGGITASGLLVEHPEITAAACIMGTPAPVAYSQLIFKSANKHGRPIPSDLKQTLTWLEHFDLSLHPDRLNQRPFLLWHGTEDYKIPYQDVQDFYLKVQKKLVGSQTHLLTGQDKGHLVTPETMDTITDFFTTSLLA